MKASPIFLLWGSFTLGVAAAAAGASRQKGAGAHQEAGEERFVRYHPRYTFYCENPGVPGGSVDQVLSGHIAIFRPIVCEATQVVHVMAGKHLTLYSHGLLSASNVHFIVHANAKLTLEGRKGIKLRRREASGQPLLTALGKVLIYWPARSARLRDDAAVNADRFSLVRLVDDGAVLSQVRIMHLPNLIVSGETIANSWEDDDGACPTYKIHPQGKRTDADFPLFFSTAIPTTTTTTTTPTPTPTSTTTPIPTPPTPAPTPTPVPTTPPLTIPTTSRPTPTPTIPAVTTSSTIPPITITTTPTLTPPPLTTAPTTASTPAPTTPTIRTTHTRTTVVISVVLYVCSNIVRGVKRLKGS